MTPIVILAAGQSSRMRGVDKLLEPVNGRPLLRQQVENAVATGCPVFVTVPALDHPRVSCLQGLDASPIGVPDATEGIAKSIKTAIAALPTFDAVLVTLADLVALDTSDFMSVMAAREKAPDALIWRGATTAGRPGHPILFDGSLRELFKDLTGDTGAAAIIKAQAHRVHQVPLPGERALLDLDTPEDWAAWRADQSLPRK